MLPRLSNHPSPNMPGDQVLRHQGHRAGAKLPRWHLLEWDAGQEELCAVFGTGAAPFTYPRQRGVGRELLAHRRA